MGATDPKQSCPRWSERRSPLLSFASATHQPADVSPAARAGRGPVEMRIGLNLIRVTAEAERDWQHRMQEPNADFERGLQQAL